LPASPCGAKQTFLGRPTNASLFFCFRGVFFHNWERHFWKLCLERELQRIQSGRRTMVLPPEVIPLYADWHWQANE
jgi:hypothetical protein